jgi:hypothetical protein
VRCGARNAAAAPSQRAPLAQCGFVSERAPPRRSGARAACRAGAALPPGPCGRHGRGRRRLRAGAARVGGAAGASAKSRRPLCAAATPTPRRSPLTHVLRNRTRARVRATTRCAGRTRCAASGVAAPRSAAQTLTPANCAPQSTPCQDVDLDDMRAVLDSAAGAHTCAAVRRKLTADP